MTAAASRKSDAVDFGHGLWGPPWCAECEHRRLMWCAKYHRSIYVAWRMTDGCEKAERSKRSA